MTWRKLSDFLPGVDQMWPSNDTVWHSVSREIVDLDKMAWCDPVGCTYFGPGPIVDVDAVRIAFHNDRWHQWHVRWRDGRTYLRMQTGHRVDEARGTCRREPFSGFPPIDPDFIDLKPAGPDVVELARDYPPESEPFR